MPVATHGATNRYAVPATVSTSRISCVAYVTEDRASLAKMGSAMRLDSAVSPSRSLLTGRPITSRLVTLVSSDTNQAYGPRRRTEGAADRLWTTSLAVPSRRAHRGDGLRPGRLESRPQPGTGRSLGRDHRPEPGRLPPARAGVR